MFTWKSACSASHLEFFVENFEALLRDFIRLDVVDGDLQVVEAGLVQPLDALGNQEVAVGDHARERADLADARDDLVQFADA